MMTRPLASRKQAPITPQFVLHIVGVKFERDHILLASGAVEYPAILPAVMRNGVEARAERWGWATNGAKMGLDVFRALEAAIQDGSGGFTLRADVKAEDGTICPKGTACRLELGDDNVVVVACDMPEPVAEPATSAPIEPTRSSVESPRATAKRSAESAPKSDSQI